MSGIFHALLRFLFHIGYFGPFVMGILDSSFLFLPFGNDLLVVALVARNHAGYLLYVFAAACGSTLGVFILDLVARKAGEESVTKVAGERRYNYLKKKIGQRGALALVVGCLAPPPFPFTMAVAVLSSLSYPKKRLFSIVWAARAARFLLLGWLAIHFGRQIITITKTPAFFWSMVGLIALCILGSVFSIMSWLKRGKSKGRSAISSQASPA